VLVRRVIGTGLSVAAQAGGREGHPGVLREPMKAPDPPLPDPAKCRAGPAPARPGRSSSSQPR
jgi:hypothetical protein